MSDVRIPPHWLRAMLPWEYNAKADIWTTSNGSIFFSSTGKLELSPIDTAHVSAILESIVPEES